MSEDCQNATKTHHINIRVLSLYHLKPPSQWYLNNSSQCSFYLFWMPISPRSLFTEDMTKWKPSPIAVPHDAQNTVFLVVMLILGVASIFVCFAMVAICYRFERGRGKEISLACFSSSFPCTVPYIPLFLAVISFGSGIRYLSTLELLHCLWRTFSRLLCCLPGSALARPHCALPVCHVKWLKRTI